jgi:hypothetical protein
MSTRQLRLSDPAQFRSKTKDLVGKHIHLVFTDSTSITGLLKAVDNDQVILVNTRQKEIKRRFDNIAEIYLDTLA